MELPALLPKNLSFAAKAENDATLFQLLLRNTDDFVNFFKNATDDETWSEAHLNFLKEALGWATHQFFQDKLDIDYSQVIRDAFYKHYGILSPILPYNLTLKAENQTFLSNSLLIGSQSSYLQNLIIRECRDKNRKVIEFTDLSEQELSYLVSYFNTGKLLDLWKWEQEEILDLLAIAIKWGLSDLSKECQDILKRYLTRDNVLKTFLLAYKKGWFFLESGTVDFINNLSIGVRLQAIDKDHLKFEFLDFFDRTWEIFSKLSQVVTHLVCSGKLPSEEQFEKALISCPRLKSLDLSGSELQSPFLEHIPSQVEELLLARCNWLSDSSFLELIAICPQLSSLCLSQNTQLTYIAFAALQKFKGLKSLDLARCHQIGDEELTLIANACPELSAINLTACKKISELALLNFIQSHPRITLLNVAKTNMTDSTLIELANRASFLEELDLSSCKAISGRGIEELFKRAMHLGKLTLSDCDLDLKALEALKKRFPKVEVIS